MGSGHLKMGDLTKACGVSDQAVRLYERMGLLVPVAKTEKGYRLYDASSVETLRFIKQAQRSGFILEEIKVLLHTDIRDEGACLSMKALLDRKLHAHIVHEGENRQPDQAGRPKHQQPDGNRPSCGVLVRAAVQKRPEEQDQEE